MPEYKITIEEIIPASGESRYEAKKDIYSQRVYDIKLPELVRLLNPDTVRIDFASKEMVKIQEPIKAKLT